MILLGHPTGNPISHEAALAYADAGCLEAFCTPWFPEVWQLTMLRAMPGIRRESERLARRRFEPIAGARKVQGRPAEFLRMAQRLCRLGNEGLSYQANDWLMRTMARECRRSSVTQVQSYEDCSLWQFEAAKRLGKRCVYDMPIGYYGWWEQKQEHLAKKYRDWLPASGLESTKWVRPEQKVKEMELADLVLTASSFSRRTILEFFDKDVRLTPYGADLAAAIPAVQDAERGEERRTEHPFRVVFAGTSSVRKGIPLLLQVWRDLAWKDAELVLAGSWKLSDAVKADLPRGVRYAGQLDAVELAKLYRSSDWLILPSNFEGYGLVILEALALGVPVMASDATGAPDLPSSRAVQIFPADHRDALVASLESARQFRQGDLAAEARSSVRHSDWSNYRRAVLDAVGVQP